MVGRFGIFPLWLENPCKFQPDLKLTFVIPAYTWQRPHFPFITHACTQYNKVFPHSGVNLPRPRDLTVLPILNKLFQSSFVSSICCQLSIVPFLCWICAQNKTAALVSSTLIFCRSCETYRTHISILFESVRT